MKITLFSPRWEGTRGAPASVPGVNVPSASQHWPSVINRQTPAGLSPTRQDLSGWHVAVFANALVHRWDL